MAAEVIELDPSEVAVSRTELDISAFVDADGIDWGDAEIVAYMAEGERGSAPVDYRVPNRTVTIPLMLKTVGATSFATIRTSIQAKAALMQREGGWLKRVLSDGTSTYYLDIVNATLKLSGGWLQAHRDADIDAVLTLEAIPDFYGAEVTLADHTETTLPHLVFTDTGIGGDYPARVRLVVDEDDGDDQMFLMYGVQSRYLPLNLIPNPGAEVNATDGGITSTNGTVGRTTSNQERGAGGFTITATAAPADMSIRHFSDRFAVTPGVPYSAAAYFKASTVGRSCQVYLDFYDAAEVRISSIPGAAVADTTTGFVRAMAENQIAPAGAVTAQVLCLVSTPAASEVHYIDSRMANTGATVLPFDDVDPLNSKLFYEAEGRTPLGGAAIAAGIAGSSGAGSSVMQQGTLTPTFQAMLSTQAVSAGAHLSHVGTFRVWARTQRPATNTGEVSLALEWGEGDFRLRTVNDPVVYAADEREDAYCLTDLGLVSLARVATGTQRWEGRIIAKSTVTGDDLDVDCLWLMPVDEDYGESRATLQYQTPTSFTARDEFDQTAGALTGKTAPVGGVWVGAGDADEFSVETTGKTAQRTALADSGGLTSGRLAVSGVAASVVQGAQIDGKTTYPANTRMGVLARYVSSTSFLLATLDDDYAEIYKFVAGVGMLLGRTASALAADTPYTLQLTVDAAGRFAFYVGGRLQLRGQDSVLATGGALETGKPGFFDQSVGASPATRNYDNFAAFVPAADAAMFANQSCEIRHDRVIREDSAGTIWTPTVPPLGDYLRLPPSGLEGRSCRIIIKASRNDPDTGTDPGIDDISAQVYYRPSWLTVPG